LWSETPISFESFYAKNENHVKWDKDSPNFKQQEWAKNVL